MLQNQEKCLTIVRNGGILNYAMINSKILLKGDKKMSFLTEKELCEVIKVDKVFLWKCRKNGMPFIRLGTKLVRYDLSEVLLWLRENSCTNEKK